MSTVSSTRTGSASRWGPLWGARPYDWALTEEMQTPTYTAALERTARAGCWSVGLDEAGDRSLFDLDLADQPIVLVLGAEGRGLGRLTRERCDVLVRIPMHGHVASLNVAAAATLACHEIARRRRG